MVCVSFIKRPETLKIKTLNYLFYKWLSVFIWREKTLKNIKNTRKTLEKTPKTLKKIIIFLKKTLKKRLTDFKLLWSLKAAIKTPQKTLPF